MREQVGREERGWCVLCSAVLEGRGAVCVLCSGLCAGLGCVLCSGLGCARLCSLCALLWALLGCGLCSGLWALALLTFEPFLPFINPAACSFLTVKNGSGIACSSQLRPLHPYSHSQ